MTPRQAAVAIWQAALAAADVAPRVQRALRVGGRTLTAGAARFDLDRTRRLLVLGCGKASGAMALAVEGVLGDRITDGFVVVKDGYRAPTRRVQLAEAGHPVPDARGQAAASRILRLAHEAAIGDLVIFLISGGGSALTPAPAPPVTLDDKQAVTRLLLAAGATIDELNAVRKHLSLLKGGQLARAAAPARILTLILSDVVGDPLDVIASGPTAPDPTTFGGALEVLARRGVAARAPASVRDRLEAGRRGELEETPKPGDPMFERVANLVIGNNALVVDAAAERARALGYAPHVLTRALQGEARDVARDLLERARALTPPACLVAGGETTVTVGGGGRGGRCQEFALAAALALGAGEPMVALAAGTDGTDGPTDAAGGLADAGTAARGRAAGLDAARSLQDNDAHTFLAATGDLVVSGPTNTNLLDLYLVVRSGCSAVGRSAPSA
ncbi:MAG: glycerate kinase type-2 family protein [Candidatus Rokuibacteriota bacterium]